MNKIPENLQVKIDNIKALKIPNAEKGNLIAISIIKYWDSYHKKQEFLYLTGNIGTCMHIGSSGYLNSLKRMIIGVTKTLD